MRLPGGDARALYRSIRRLLELPPQTRLFMCHDYAPGGRAHAFETTVANERAQNVQVHDGIAEDAFVAMRTDRDATLDTPRLFLPSLPVNVRPGELPPPKSNGRRYFKIPIEASTLANSWRSVARHRGAFDGQAAREQERQTGTIVFTSDVAAGSGQ